MSKVRSLLKISAVKVILAIVFIAIAVVVSFSLPKEQDPNIGLTNDPATATVGVTRPVGSMIVNRSVVYRDITIMVTKVEEAGAFSDDRKRAGLFTVRVSVHVQPGDTIQTPVGIEFATLVRLVLPNGQVISPKLATVLPIVFPKQAKDGFFDFAVPSQVPLSPLVLQVGTASSVAFGQ
ncbi:MAG: hypothetical protein E6I91_04800 [Chloroflexi bacterium]|nr:MAG: hypothetical protein E6I91_04800 [Chloroflexota bacterium]